MDFTSVSTAVATNLADYQAGLLIVIGFLVAIAVGRKLIGLMNKH